MLLLNACINEGLSLVVGVDWRIVDTSLTSFQIPRSIPYMKKIIFSGGARNFREPGQKSQSLFLLILYLISTNFALGFV